MRRTLRALRAPPVLAFAASGARSATGAASSALDQAQNDPSLRTTHPAVVVLAGLGGTFRNGVRVRNRTAHTAAATFAVTVTALRYRAVFNGAKPLARQAKHATGGSMLLVLLAGAPAVLAPLSLSHVLGVRRWPRR